MGTYTELVLKCTLKNDLPQKVDAALRYLFCDNYPTPTELPDHEFFKKPRWEAVGKSGSYYHCPRPLYFYDGKYLFTRTDLKNYDDEIATFLDWLMPYMSCPPGKFIGWVFCEQSREPEFIHMPGDWDE